MGSFRNFVLAIVCPWVFCASPLAAAELPENLNCTAYIYGDVPFMTFFLKAQADGTIASPTQVEHYGQRQFVPVAHLQTQTDEMLHLLIGNDGDQLRLIVYNADATATGWRGVLINDNSPAMKEMQAKCVDHISGL
ncbi:MAG: hypothetical protein RIQ81_664 [Pseudomonadota bacterium]|jgi:hypothetical protein